jgi:hypothetical protein
MGPDPHATATVLVLAELALFWTTAVLHLLRLVGLQGSSRTERLADAGHVAMGLGMAIMLFPGVPVAVLRASALVFTVLAAVFLALALQRRASPGQRSEGVAIGIGQSATAYMLAAPTHPPSWLANALAASLAACLLLHGRRLISARHADWPPGTWPALAALPHAATVATTAAMAWTITNP